MPYRRNESADVIKNTLYIEPGNKASNAASTVDEHYRSLYEYNFLTILIIDPATGAIVDANPTACGFYGYEREQLKSMYIFEINSLSENQVKTEMQKAISMKSSLFSFKHRLSNGKMRDVEVYSVPIMWNNRKLLFSVIFDVSEKQKAQKLLEASEESYRRLVELSPDAIIVCCAGRIVFANTQAAVLLGMPSAEDLKGRLFYEFIHNWDHLLVKKLLQRKRKDKKAEYESLELQIISLDEQPIDVEARSADFVFNGKAAKQIVLRNVTEQKRELLKASQIQRHRQNIRFPLDEYASSTSIYMPSKQVSGDFFQFYRYNDEIVTGIIGDVRGKGITAALDTTALKVLFYDGALYTCEPIEIVRFLNQEVIRHLDEEYVAVCCFSLDFGRKEAKIAGAGINQYVINRSSGEWDERVVMGSFLGMFEDSYFDQHTVSFGSGDRLYFYTDGMDFIFENARIKNKCAKMNSIELVKDYFKNALSGYNTLYDDCTWLAIQIK